MAWGWVRGKSIQKPYILRMWSVWNNMLSVTQHLEVNRDYLAKECSEDKVMGPFVLLAMYS